jgi:hypothetical protein
MEAAITQIEEPKKYKFGAKELRTPEGKREYYRYYLDVPESLVEKPAPTLQDVPIEEINRQLKEIAGTDAHGDPIFKASWAGTLPEIKYQEYSDSEGVLKTKEFIGKKYAYYRRRVQDGYEFLNDEGHRIFVKNQNQIPSGKVARVVSHVEELGELYWVVEMKYTAEQMVAAGFLPDPDSERAKTFCIKNGNRYRKPFDPKGEYVFAFFCQELVADSDYAEPVPYYRDIGRQDVETVRAIWHRANNESESEFAERVIKQEQRIERIKAHRKAESDKAAIQDAADRLERIANRQNKGRLITSYGR